jgi:hypothetical protein
MADVTVPRSSRSSGARRGPAEDAERPEPLSDPRAVRVGLGPASRPGDEAPLVVAPPPEPLEPIRHSLAGRGPLGGAVRDTRADSSSGSDDPIEVSDVGPALGPTFLVDGEPMTIRLVRRGPRRAVLVVGEGSEATSHRVVLPAAPRVGTDGVARRELVVDGWRIELELEPERRAALRERARRGRESTARGGPTEIKAIIPGRVVAVSVAAGDPITPASRSSSSRR